MRNRVDGWIDVGYGCRDSVDIVCDTERMKLQEEYDKHNSVGAVNHNGRLNGECRDVERARCILYNFYS